MTLHQGTLFSSVPTSNSLVSNTLKGFLSWHRLLDSPCAMLPEHQRNKGHCQIQLTHTLIVRLLKTHFFTHRSLIVTSLQLRIELVTWPFLNIRPPPSVSAGSSASFPASLRHRVPASQNSRHDSGRRLELGPDEDSPLLHSMGLRLRPDQSHGHQVWAWGWRRQQWIIQVWAPKHFYAFLVLLNNIHWFACRGQRGAFWADIAPFKSPQPCIVRPIWNYRDRLGSCFAWFNLIKHRHL